MTHKGLHFAFLAGCILCALLAGASEPPSISKSAGELIVNGKPYLILGGELGNSSAGTAAEADSILPKLATMHVNTVLMPVAWEQIEPQESNFDFNILDHWIDVARQEHLHLVVLWFGSWKNAFSSYAPAWVKSDTRRFPRAVSTDGNELEILSTLGKETQKADGKAFSSLMTHIREKDGEEQTVLMVQVENEVGYLGAGRDRSPAANQLFHESVPTALIQKLRDSRESLSPELAAHFHSEGKTWQEVFGEAADEVFMAWNYATYIQSVAQEGKRAYSLPMYVNAQLPAPAERSGEYPSGGPHPYYLDVYRITAPALDFFSPDIYWPNFEYWINRYAIKGNAVFVPEARLEAAPFNAFYAFGEAKAFGFAAFGIDSVDVSADRADNPTPMEQTYKALDDLSEMIVPAQTLGKTRGLVMHAASPRPTQTVAQDGYLFEATLSRSWPAKTLLTEDGAMIIVQSKPNEFFIAGRGLTVTFTRDPDRDDRVAGIASIEQVSRVDGNWITQRRLNGDQSNQGRQLSMAANQVKTYRVVLYTYERERQPK